MESGKVFYNRIYFSRNACLSLLHIFSAIIFAANNGHLDVVKELIALGANIEDRSNNWKTPLLWASLWGHFPVAKYLVSIGANISATDVYGLTTVMSATLSGNANLVQYLIEQGANVKAKNYYNGTAYSIAKSKGNEEVLTILRPYFSEEEDYRSPYEILFSVVYEYVAFFSQLFISEITSIFGEHKPPKNPEL